MITIKNRSESGEFRFENKLKLENKYQKPALQFRKKKLCRGTKEKWRVHNF